MKVKTLFTCTKCTYQSPKWIGKCPECNEWNSFSEEIISPERKHQSVKAKPKNITPLTHIKQETKERLKTNISELDQVLGGGIITDSLILLGGEPGIGKSTLTLQICNQVSLQKKRILYITGEESISQIANRAERLNIKAEGLSVINENNLETILATIEHEKPDLTIVDSIQTTLSENIPGTSGSVSQVRYATEGLMNLAKQHGLPIILIGHVTKDGNLAGPRVLEHLVDTVLQLEGDRYQNFRILRSIKNRFGSTNEIGVFEMKAKGLIEVTNASSSFLEGRQKQPIGSCITCIIEGTRPFLLEVQALTNTTPFGYPKRTASGFDVNRLNLLIAVLQKYAKINLSNQDVYINITGGFRVQEPAADLAICLAIISSFKKTPLANNLLAVGEVGLSGEIRKVNQLEKRLKEGKRMGFDHPPQEKQIQNIKI